jgi:hypothetical protein
MAYPTVALDDGVGITVIHIGSAIATTDLVSKVKLALSHKTSAKPPKKPSAKPPKKPSAKPPKKPCAKRVTAHAA